MTRRVFAEGDQRAFAEISGDRNPMHMDPVAARRTPAGAPVVHGVQSMLWALEQVAAMRPLERLCRLDADFSRFLHLGEPAELIIPRENEDEIRAELRSGDRRIAQYVLRFGEKAPARVSPPAETHGALHYGPDRDDPLPLSWEETAVAQGRVAFRHSANSATPFWPNLASAIGAERVTGLLGMTRLVGMVAPGLHSTFHRISLHLTEDDGPQEAGLRFSVARAEPRFQVVTFSVGSTGLTGSVKASRRTPPVQQPDSAALRPLIAGRIYAGRTALVVGGSRGIGEVTAKLLGLAGARVIISYAVGAADAAAVAADIVAAGGQATTMPLDVLADLEPQLAHLPHQPTSMYFFATRRIAPRTGTTVDEAMFRGFCDVYVMAFERLCLLLAARAPISVFYPSSVYVEAPPTGLVEYAMAKAAGEVLAQALTREHDRLDVYTVRLPRLPTDQTAAMIEQETGSVVEHILPVIQRMESVPETVEA